MALKDHLKYLQKMGRKEITEAEMKEYISLLVKDNVFNIEGKYIDVGFPDFIECNSDGEFVQQENGEKDIINISSSYIRANCFKEKYYETISTLGHEIRHYVQYNCNFEQELNNNPDEYYKNIDNAIKSRNVEKFSSQELGFLYDIEKINESVATQDFMNYFKQSGFEELAEIPHLKEWLEKNKDNTNLKNEIEYSEYLQRSHEEDARYSEVLFAQFLLSEYKREFEFLNDPDLQNFFDDMEKQKELAVKSIEDQHQKGVKYKEFINTFDNIEYQDLVKLDQLSQETKDFMKSALYSSCLDFYTSKYVQNAEPEKLEVMYNSFINDYFEKNKNRQNQKVNMSYKSLESKMIESIVNSNLSLEQKQEFGNHIYQKYMDNLSDITLTEQDQLLSYLYANRVISPEQMSNIVNTLCNQERYLETNNILKINIEKRPCIEEKAEYACAKCFLARMEILKKSIEKTLNFEEITMEELLFMDNEWLNFKEEYDNFRFNVFDDDLPYFHKQYEEINDKIMEKENQALIENKMFLKNTTPYESLVQKQKENINQLENSSFTM